MRKQDYKDQIIHMVSELEDVVLLESVYWFIKTMLSIKKGGAV